MVKGLGSVPRYGPGSVLIHVPKAHQWATLLNHYLREESSLTKKIQELAMLVTARELDCQHIWNAHAGSARKAGVPSELVDALRDRKQLPALAADEGAVVNYGREFFRTRRVSRGAFQAALEANGYGEALVDWLVGHAPKTTRGKHYARPAENILRAAVDSIPAIDWGASRDNVVPLRRRARE